MSAAVALCIAVAPTLSVLSGGSRSGAAIRTVDGIARVIDQLKPGMTVWIWYSGPDSSAEVLLGGHSVSMTDGNGSISQAVRWRLPTMSLDPGQTYAAALVGDSVEVTSAVRS